MSALLEAVLAYAAGGWPVFPCDARKRPYTEHGFKDASTDERQIRKWWTRWPHALIGMPTGERTDLAVLDIDMKNGQNGLRTLARLLETEDLPITPTTQTASGGYHLHFQRSDGGFGNTVGAGGRGIGEGLDWRCDGGYVVLPAPGTGYRWTEQSYATCMPIAVPDVLLPRQRDTSTHARHWGRTGGAITVNSLIGVARKVAAATAPREEAKGERNALLFWGTCRFGEAITRGLIDEDDARRILTEAASRTGLPSREITRTIDSAFTRIGR